MNRMTRASAMLLAALLIGASLHSCAYFNTLYNARKEYREAEKAAQTSGSGREQRDKYKKVVEKCEQLIQNYPKSRWVDDAIFLMGMALVRQEEYDKGIREFDEILTDFPESGYAPQALYWLAYSYDKKKDYDQALVYTERFLKDYPKNDLRFQVLFLGGDIKRELEDYDGALGFYTRVADEARKKDIVDEARYKSAELLYARGEWAKAAAAYEALLRKGITWERRYKISLALGECYIKTAKCREALLLFNDLIEKATSTQDMPPLYVGRADSYVCMDSLAKALSAYDDAITKFPKSQYSAEAYYRKGVIYHEKLDSLSAAQRAFSKVAGEYPNSEYAAVSIEKSGSMTRLLELQKSAGTETREQVAEKRLMAAEIQLTRLGNVSTALAGYTSLLDSFPETASAPKSAYAIAWIYQFQLKDNGKAIDRYRSLVKSYPRSPQAKGALFQLGFLGAAALRDSLRAFVDSARADTAAARREAAAAARKAAAVPSPHAAAARPDTSSRARMQVPPDTLGRARIKVFSDSLSRARMKAPPVFHDTSGVRRLRPPSAPVDTTGRLKKGDG